MILRVICDKMMTIGKPLAAVFIVYKAVFDSISHKFVDKTLKEADVSTKAHAIFRAIYKAAAVFKTASVTDGKQIWSDTFSIDRGVLQGDVISPLFFIMTLELILRRYDAADDIKGVPLAKFLVNLLGYADDVAVTVLDLRSAEGIQRLSTRVTSSSKGSKKDADMILIKEKTEAMHVQEQNETDTSLPDNPRGSL